LTRIQTEPRGFDNDYGELVLADEVGQPVDDTDLPVGAVPLEQATADADAQAVDLERKPSRIKTRKSSKSVKRQNTDVITSLY
jgi:hypothetical protein